VRDVLRDPRAESMVRAMAQLARSMSIITVAEYIETEEIGDRVAELGVDYGQGFAIGKPLPLTELLAELPLAEAPGAAAAAPAEILLPDEPEVDEPETGAPLELGELEAEAAADAPTLTAEAFEESDPDAVTCEAVVLETPEGESTEPAGAEAVAIDGAASDGHGEAEAEILAALEQVAASTAASGNGHGAALDEAAPLAAGASPEGTEDANTDVQPELVVWYAGAAP
jgi:hypothetical protein